MKIVELFKSIEGEGIRTGKVATFIRSFGCNCRCVYCDSLYAINGQYADKYPDMTINEIVDKCKEFKTPYVTFTGGEPLIQPQAKELIIALLNNGFEVNVETNGAVDIEPIKKDIFNDVKSYDFSKLFFTVDYKSLSSGANDMMVPKNFTRSLSKNDVVKFVVGTKEDLDDMKKWVNIMIHYYGYDNMPHVFVSPIFDMIDPKDIVEYIKDNDLFDVRMQLQIHKYIWNKDMKGV